VADSADDRDSRHRGRHPDVGCVQITDAGLVHVEPLTGLEQLGLTGTQVTDAGVLRLTRLKKLRELSLIGTQVTEETFDELQKALPRCHIFW
jgi:hypothetical protein